MDLLERYQKKIDAIILYTLDLSHIIGYLGDVALERGPKREILAKALCEYREELDQKERDRIDNLGDYVREIYRAHRRELGLQYNSWEFDSYHITDLAIDDVLNGRKETLDRLAILLEGIQTLKAQEEWESQRKALQAETPPQQGEGKGKGKERQKRNSVMIRINEECTTLTIYQALCLLAYRDAVKKRRPYITPDIIAERVWPDISPMSRVKRLKPHWSKLRDALKKKDFELPGFSMKAVDGVRNYQLGRPPKWLKDVYFPNTLLLPPKLGGSG